MRFLSIQEEHIRAAAEVIKAGGLAAFPTETVYGLGADGFNPSALARIFEAKGRPRFDPLIIHIAAWNALDRVADLDALEPAARSKARLLGERLWPGPLTLILPKQSRVPDLATSGLATVAVRFPDHPVAQRLIALSSGAVAAPSANPFGYLSPTRAGHVRDQLGDRVDLILDGGPVAVGLESTVLDLCSSRPRILRPGGMSQERIEALIGPVSSGGHWSETKASPGMLKSHYAPRTPLALWDRRGMLALQRRSGEGYVFFDGPSRDAWLGRPGPAADASIQVLSGTGSLSEAAARLFDTLHYLDTLPLSRIHAQEAPGAGLAPAINDRLRRAAARY
jgi:L-threonylcarbamoyladenylate synthase